jgi:hypothetical protein
MAVLTGGQAEGQRKMSFAGPTRVRHIVHTFLHTPKFDIGVTLSSGSDYEL